MTATITCLLCRRGTPHVCAAGVSVRKEASRFLPWINQINPDYQAAREATIRRHVELQAQGKCVRCGKFSTMLDDGVCLRCDTE